jgi:hypothetical protein
VAFALLSNLVGRFLLSKLVGRYTGFHDTAVIGKRDFLMLPS